MTLTEMERIIGASKGVLTKAASKGTNIQLRWLEAIAEKFPSWNAEWVITGRGESTGVDKQNDEPQTTNKETRPHIPIEVAAGLTTGFAECVALRDCEMRPIIDAFPNYDYTITIKGDSMEPKYESGDIIAIKQITDYIEWGKTYVVSTREGAVVKRLYPPKHNDKAFECVSYNIDYPAFELDKDSILALYKVVGLLRVC